MTPEPPASVFASYSRKDEELVSDLLALYRAIDVPAFRDAQSIKPGQKWRIEIDAALTQCQVILVFWCGHAAASSEVRSEYERAISLGKRVVPVLMDQTALPPNLGQYQGVDLRLMLRGHERMINQLEPRPQGGFPGPEDSEDSLKNARMLYARLSSASKQLRSSLTAEFGEYIPLDMELVDTVRAPRRRNSIP